MRILGFPGILGFTQAFPKLEYHKFGLVFQVLRASLVCVDRPVGEDGGRHVCIISGRDLQMTLIIEQLKFTQS